MQATTVSEGCRMATQEQDRQVEGARTQNLLREVNERVEELSDTRSFDVELLCECANKDCVQTIPLTRDEYEHVRRVPTRFFVLLGHDVPEIERVVERTDRYVVVEKFGEGGKVAVRLDPRRHTPAEPKPRY